MYFVILCCSSWQESCVIFSQFILQSLDLLLSTQKCPGLLVLGGFLAYSAYSAYSQFAKSSPPLNTLFAANGANGTNGKAFAPLVKQLVPLASPLIALANQRYNNITNNTIVRASDAVGRANCTNVTIR